MAGHDTADEPTQTGMPTGAGDERPTYTLVTEPAGGMPATTCTDLATADDGRPVNYLAVTYPEDASPDAVVEGLDRQPGPGPADLGIISVGEKTRSAAARTAPSPVASTGLVTTVDSPTDLAGLGIAITTYLEGWADGDARTTVCFMSLTSLLKHVGVETAFRFLRVFKQRVADVDAVAHFHLDPSAHREDTLRPICELFDRFVGGHPLEADATAASTDAGAASEAAEEPSPELVRRVLAMPRRLRTLGILLEEGGPLPVAELAERMARKRSFGSAVMDDAVTDTRVALSHNHLPLLERYGLVALYDDASRVEALERARWLIERVDLGAAGDASLADVDDLDLDGGEP